MGNWNMIGWICVRKKKKKSFLEHAGIKGNLLNSISVTLILKTRVTTKLYKKTQKPKQIYK